MITSSRSLPADKKIFILCGTGGVGKTSIAAALALSLAKIGKKVGLMTIDPAKRLASALQLKNLDPIPREISYLFTNLLPSPIRGSLSALVYDPESTLDAFIREEGGEAIYQSLKSNPLYQIISRQFAGMHEYLVLEKMHELHKKYFFDCIVIDTPPSQHMLDFVDAPAQLAKFFDDRVFRWFLTEPQGNNIFEKIRAHGTKKAFSILEKVTGATVLQNFIAMAPAIYNLKKSFLYNQNKIQSILQSDATGTVFVANSQNLIIPELKNFMEESKSRKIKPSALFLNRSMECFAPISMKAMEAKIFADFPESTKSQSLEIALQNYSQIRNMVEYENSHIAALKKSWKDSLPLVRLSELEQWSSPLEIISTLSKEIDFVLS